MADGIILEELGVPAVSIVTDAFTRSSDAMARRRGMRGYRYAMLPHPISSLTPEECKLRAAEILPEVMSILGLGDKDEASSRIGTAHASPEDAGAGKTRIKAPAMEEIQSMERIVEYGYEQGWTDGLPVVPATAERVASWVAYAGRDAKEVVGTVAHVDRACTVELAAAASIMAGCRIEYFPVVLAAMEAYTGLWTLTEPKGYATGLFQSTSGQSQLLIVNGPLRQKLDFNSKGNVLGSGFRANATVGRAIRLITMNAFSLRPHEFDQSTQGTPSKYSFCIAENEEESPWEPLHVERGFAPERSAVTVTTARSTLHVDNRVSHKPEEVLLTIADSMSYGGAWEARTGYVVVLAPEHAHLLAKHGWTRRAATEFIWQNWGRRRGELRRFGLIQEGVEDKRATAAAQGQTYVEASRYFDEGSDAEFLPYADSPESMLLIVAGAWNAGISSVVQSLSVFATAAIKEPAPGE